MRTVISFVIFLILLGLIYSSDFGFRSRKYANRAQYPPAKVFRGEALSAAQKMFDGDIAGMEQEIKQKNVNLDQLDPEKGYTLLMYAAIIEDIKAMRRLLELGANPNIISADYSTPLKHAVALNNYKMADLLFEFKADPNPKVGNSPLVTALSLAGFKYVEKNMVDYLLAHGADINNISLSGHNIMKEVTLDDLDMALYFLEKGGQPIIEGTNLSPMAEYIQSEEKWLKKINKSETEYSKKLLSLKQLLIEKYGVQFPYQKDTIQEAKLKIELYEALSPQDKISINFRYNYGENSYQEDLELIKNSE
ncbi:ankyrin repeat domain-containing protein [Capnocytophaga canimorsus]|uniref:ankyrin repeat domain-containing protein n=1 Tax=Capnocytophaga canimorsus TaxID=28188 RepID=UPI0021001915|nr:ankyrin repeat domain-containing protein [Capnocytophaga canimorsus]